jgi:hypothetical protein
LSGGTTSLPQINVAFFDLYGQSCQFAGAYEYAGKHWAVEPSGVGVAQRGVVAAKEAQTVGQDVFGAMCKAVVRFLLDDAGVEQVGEIAIPCDLAEADDDTDSREGVDFGGEMLRAVTDLLREGFVAGWGAADDGGDPGVTEFKTVVAGDSERFGGETEIVEHRVHEVSGTVAGEGTAGAVGTVGAGSESKNQDTGTWISKAGDGASPVGLVLVGAAAGLADPTAVVAQPRATLAGDDGVVNLLE